MSVEIGSYLRQARESIGLSLDLLQEKTKIQKSFLVAIENGQFNKLPSPFYVRSYLRSYANCVKIEPNHILRQYRKEEQAERGLVSNNKEVESISQPKHTKVNTALTIAQSSLTQVSSQVNETARREFGYQRVGQNTLRGFRPVQHVTSLEVASTSSSIVPVDRECSVPPRRSRTKFSSGKIIDSLSFLFLSSRKKRLLPEREELNQEGALLPVLTGKQSRRDRIRAQFQSRKLVHIVIGIVLLLFVVVTSFLFIEKKVWSQTMTKLTTLFHQTDDPAIKITQKGKLDLIEEGKSLNFYSLSHANVIEIRFNGKEESGSWVQIRRDLKIDTNYIADVTVTKGKTYRLFYRFNDKRQDLYIRLGRPQNVMVSINGYDIKTNYILHIKKRSLSKPKQ